MPAVEPRRPGAPIGQVMRFNFLRPKARPVTNPVVVSTDGRVVYAVGDIHGHLDLLDDLLDIIARDFAQLREREPGRKDRPVLIFVGDYIDRGPASRGVIDRVLALKALSDGGSGFEVRALMGNHEQTLLSFLDTPEAGAAWVEFGGGETLTSYDVVRPPGRGDADSWRVVQAQFQHNLPADHLAFLRALELSARYGDYLFVHAGVRPGVPWDRQEPEDLLWIRNDFLSLPHRLGCIVVHGHTPDAEPFIGSDRINIDTGAYATGVLTAIRLTESPPVVLQARKSRRV
ncbi:metallophosphoesterase family protein [Caulobacter sp. Root655]|uniref:metallophosphoesterase family protein n=1 Tax=Caulobacter sp. Root655 TaxID=1736578 RepID=UPI0034CFD69B